MPSYAPYLTDAAAPGTFSVAISWLENAASGSVATSVTASAVAGLGLLLLTGRIAVRRGAVVILGCFLVFGARSIAAGLLGNDAHPANLVSRDASRPSPLPSVAASPQAYDPYAGASLIR